MYSWRRPDLKPGLLGVIKSFEDAAGYGFIYSPEARKKYSRDVFLHRKQLKEFKVGDAVRFQVNENRDGHPQASKLRPAPGETVILPEEPAAPVPQEKPEKEVFIGEIKSFSPVNGFGFIVNEKLYERFKRDVFLHESRSSRG
ncbi:unnamed protein product [Effrenium voratum]|uniref:CSD domain-containing protein n=1 Tax=Effrenium voratum TaxID=2562239 RepID=A0AA36J772_9DINO|nr:unnamed protein product [Effrenium voratum]CAJ1460891.1 unnamed protein product [Effrenium voratum]